MQHLDITTNHTSVLVLCYSSDMVVKINEEYERFSSSLLNIRAFVDSQIEDLVEAIDAHIIIGTPKIIQSLAQSDKIKLKNLKQLILSECDTMFVDFGKFCR